MAKSRRKLPYWRRNIPAAQFDIAKLRPKSLPRGKRFETPRDAHEESVRSAALLATNRQGRSYSVFLQDCREGHYHCEKTYCPDCSRTFRRYITGELLRLHAGSKTKPSVFVILLEAVPRGRLLKLQIDRYRHSLRKRLDRAGLGHVPVVGGFEIVYRARSKEWVLHINLVMFGGDEGAIAGDKRNDYSGRGSRHDGSVAESKRNCNISRATHCSSFVPKFAGPLLFPKPRRSRIPATRVGW